MKLHLKAIDTLEEIQAKQYPSLYDTPLLASSSVFQITVASVADISITIGTSNICGGVTSGNGSVVTVCTGLYVGPLPT